MQRMLEHFDLFEWADARDEAVRGGEVSGRVIHAERVFQKKTVAYIRQIMIGWVPPTSGGADPIDLREVRAMRRNSSKKVERLGVEEAANA